MKKLVSLGISLALLTLIWIGVDVAAVRAAAAAADPVWLAAGLAAVVPLTLGTAWRLRMLSRAPIGLGAATRMTLSAATLNLVLPSKMGDLAKSVVLVRRYGFDAKTSLALVVLEKLLDMVALLALGLVALAWAGDLPPWRWPAIAGVAALLGLLLLVILPSARGAAPLAALARRLPVRLARLATGFGAEWRVGIDWFWADARRASAIAALSLALWGLHLFQFWLFAQALAPVPPLDNMAFATLAILAGLVPLTLAGVGTRDAAILFLYQPYLSPGQGAVLGVLATSRYLMPALAGLPFVRDLLATRRAATAA